MEFHVYFPDDPLHVEGLEAVCAGIRSHGLQPTIKGINDVYQPCHVLVTFGVAKDITPRGRAVRELVEAHKQNHLPLPKSGECPPVEAAHLVIERGFIRRDEYFMVGWNGLNGRAQYFNRNSRSDRWQNLGTELAPWREEGNHVVLCGQVPWDASVQHTDHRRWCQATASFLVDNSTRPVRFRPHPLQRDAIPMEIPGVELSEAETLTEDLQDAWAVVTFNSNAGVEATLGGVPAFVADAGAMGYGVLCNDLKWINDPPIPQRDQWLCDLAYTQWTLEEIAAGDAFGHLYLQQQNWLVRSRYWFRNLPIFRSAMAEPAPEETDALEQRRAA
ncbi:MAG: hypothetical protein AAF394_12535 [Planctomycetota bacterium]